MRDFDPIRYLRSAFALAALGLATLCLNGCGPKVEMKELPPPVDEKMSTDDQTKVKEYLDKAGKKGTPMAISDQGDHWLVEFQPEAVEVPGRRPQPTVAESFRVDKATGAVTSALGN